MKPEWCDEKTWETADYLFRCSSADVIALALRKAHQRGRREGMEEAAGMVEIIGFSAEFIRAKAQEVSS